MRNLAPRRHGAQGGIAAAGAGRYGGGMILFGTLFAINIAAAMVAFAFFIIGLADGTVTTFNILIWAAMLGVLFSLPFAGWLLRVRGLRRMATIVLLPMGVVTVLGALVTVVMIVNPPRWQ
jgi:hypothetical protein